MECALAANATSVILAHNHPSGVACPSDEDRFTTMRVAEALDMVDVILVDHLVVSDEDVVSLRESGLYDPSRCRVRV